MSDYVQVQVVDSDRDALLDLVTHTVRERLAACGQVLGPITSTYWWEGAVETAEEWIALLKTTRARMEELTAVLADRHSYDVPEIIAVPVTSGLSSYLDWIREETQER